MLLGTMVFFSSLENAVIFRHRASASRRHFLVLEAQVIAEYDGCRSAYEGLPRPSIAPRTLTIRH